MYKISMTYYTGFQVCTVNYGPFDTIEQILDFMGVSWSYDLNDTIRKGL